jgi:hypothetical protein
VLALHTQRLRAHLAACASRHFTPSHLLQQPSDLDRKAIEEAIDLICMMLVMTPSKRPSASDIHSKNFFHESEPKATPRHLLEGISSSDNHSMGTARTNEGTRFWFAGALQRVFSSCRWEPRSHKSMLCK